ncbi:unnamed protein product [Paramecium sonneborni]|uniref:Uncharacterized protein n=1 Tax=Paramecium sonneborni TaxID=65129 RepID=A0A8S1PVQ2_9CILI|nr:unnamed protein product [Paramecium sonneborni]
MLLNKGLYKHQYCLSLHSNPDPVKITFHFQESQPICPLIKMPTQKVEWLQAKFPSIKSRYQNTESQTERPKINQKKCHSRLPSQVRSTPTSPFTIIMRTNNPSSNNEFDNSITKTIRYEQFQNKQYLVNKYLAPRKLGLHRGINLVNFGIDK